MYLVGVVVFTLMFFSGYFSLCVRGLHFLFLLLSLEFINLSLYGMFYFYFLEVSGEYYFGMLFISMVVSEGALGISILVSLIRSFGDDFFQSLSLLW
uniref:NADH-ubiquinone oxidoreductase chain 4L n=1 Tax=Elateroidea sp. BMNH 1274729 TaxID=1796501 RepID=A0A126TGF1_9COLE|nr:NADH dehydrogenase subunit 4L [Elateroidea sp. BMNH 1274729]